MLLALAGWLAVSREPSHDGLSLSEWIADLAEASRTQEEAADALRAMGSRGISTLLGWLQTRDSRLGTRLRELAARQSWFTIAPDSSWEKRERAVAGFCLLGTDGAPAIPRLVPLIDDSEIGPVALGALRGIGLPSGPALLAALTHHHAEARKGAVQVLAGEPFIDLPQTFPALLRSLNDSDYQVQLTTIGALGRCERRSEEVLPALACRALDPNFAGRAFAIRALVDAQAGPDLVLSVVLAALENGDADSRRAAMACLLRVEGEAALEPLVKALHDRDVVVRCKAAVALGKFPEHLDRLLPLLHERLTNDLPVVRAAAANGLSKFGPTAQSVVPDLLQLHRDSFSMFQNMAARALLKIDPRAAAQAGIRPDETPLPLPRRNPPPPVPGPP